MTLAGVQGFYSIPHMRGKAFLLTKIAYLCAAACMPTVTGIEATMRLYPVVLYVHILATLVLFAALSFEALMLYRLRRASSLAEARPWIDPVPGLHLMASGSLLVLLLSGGYLTDAISAWKLAWPKLAVAAIVLFGALAGLASVRIRAIRRICAEDKTSQTELAHALQDCILRGSVSVRMGLIFGIVLIMTAKPGALESLTILAISVIFGLAAIYLTRGERTVVSPNAPLHGGASTRPFSE